MRFWKPLTKFHYTNDRNEFKYHTDFSLEEDEDIEVKICGRKLIKDKPPKGKIYKIHLEMAVEEFDKDE